jgi:hypothetical protein
VRRSSSCSRAYSWSSRAAKKARARTAALSERAAAVDRVAAALDQALVLEGVDHRDQVAGVEADAPRHVGLRQRAEAHQAGEHAVRRHLRALLRGLRAAARLAQQQHHQEEGRAQQRRRQRTAGGRGGGGVGHESLADGVG